jgi:hypothetical protein
MTPNPTAAPAGGISPTPTAVRAGGSHLIAVTAEEGP